MTGGPRFSVVIPAHQEERTIARCLAPLHRLIASGEAEVVVVVNGSTDRTAEVARRTDGVQVVETPVPSKAAALNLGDATARTFPRIYLDADIVVTARGLSALATALDTPLPCAGNLRLEVDTRECSWAVRLFYKAFLQMPYAQEGLIGLGLYGVSEQGRGRFGAFPEQQSADDLLVDRLFTAEERVVLDDHAFRVSAPRTTADLLAVRTRVHRGNAELSAGEDDARFALSTGSSSAALASLVLADPRQLPGALTYAAVTVVARRRARARSRAGVQKWDRDTSTR